MNEKELIQLLRQGDEPAFRWLVETYRNRVFHTAINIVQDEKEAEDVAQETFIQVFESVKTFKEEASLSTWIYRITVRKAIDKTRRKKTRMRLHQWLPWWMPDEKKSHAPGFYHPGIAAENKEKAAALFKAIESLPEKQRLAFTLVKVQGLKYEEVCEIMQQNVKAVESLISRAKVKLQQQLEQYYKKGKEL
ncbi:MAG TPA: RNA polymerase sigma factor [Chitinophagaceae bacterium]|nr:RNA polymerase sigma factor [Chitinophagaceae bacterium]